MNSSEEQPIEFDDILTFSGITIARKGRFIFAENTNTPEEQRELLRSIARHCQDVEESIERSVEELQQIIAQFNPLDLVTNVVLKNAVLNADTYKEYSHDGNQAYAEYATLLCLRNSYGAYPVEKREPISGLVIEDLQERISALFKDHMLWLAFKDVDPEQPEPPDAMERLRVEALGESLFVRNPAYHHHLVDVLRGVFSPVAEVLDQVLGFKIEDALSLSEAISVIRDRKIEVKRRESKSYQRGLHQAVTNCRRGIRETGGFPVEVSQHLAAMTPSDSAHAIECAAVAMLFTAIGETFCFTIDELVESAEVDRETAAAFLEFMSIEFGQVDQEYTRYPAPTHPLMVKPIVAVEDRFFCPLPQWLYWGILPGLESALNPDSAPDINSDVKLWNRYETARAAYLEDRSVYYLGQALERAEVYRNLRYVVEEGELSKRVELDGLLTLDSVLFLVEAKAGTVTRPTRRGAPLSIQSALEDLVTEAHQQCLRAKQYIQERETAEFQLPNGEHLIVQADHSDRFFLVNVTLDYLSAFATNLYRLEDIDVLEGELPWSVSLTDLRVICEMVEFPSQLLHYLERRLRLNELRSTTAHDELDWFGHYLQEGLYFEDWFADPTARPINLLSYTTGFDDYYLYEMGLRPEPAEKPRQPMPGVMRQIIEELEDAHPSGYLAVVETLLDLASDSRQSFAAHATEWRERALRDRELTDFSMVFTDGGFGLTYMFLPRQRASELPVRLMSYCLLKKYQTRCDRWVGLGCIADQEGWAHLAYSATDPWSYDRELERQVREVLPE